VYAPIAFETGPAWLNTIYLYLTNGQGAVALFFVLSGHVLMHSLEREPKPDWRAVLRFLARRALRIYPPYIAMVVLCLLIFRTTGLYILGSSPSDFETGTLFAQMLLYRSSINGVAWTLQVELLGALLIVIAWIALRVWGAKALILILLVFFALSFTKRMNWVVDLVMVTPFSYMQFLYAFIAGMLITPWSRVLATIRLPRRLLALYPLAGLVLLCAAPELVGYTSKFRVLLEVFGDHRDHTKCKFCIGVASE
jgi:peptidoglycan/LPS O-acetylase OafA/YrhL